MIWSDLDGEKENNPDVGDAVEGSPRNYLGYEIEIREVLLQHYYRGVEPNSTALGVHRVPIFRVIGYRYSIPVPRKTLEVDLDTVDLSD